MAISDIRGRDNFDIGNLANLLTKIFWLVVSFGALFYFGSDEILGKVSFVVVTGKFAVFFNIEIYRHFSYTNYFCWSIYQYRAGKFGVLQEERSGGSHALGRKSPW